MTEYDLIAFVSPNAAIAAQDLLEGVCPFQVMPVLREISTGCGIALRVSPAHLAAARAALTASSLAADGYRFFSVSGSGPTLTVNPLP